VNTLKEDGNRFEQAKTMMNWEHHLPDGIHFIHQNFSELPFTYAVPTYRKPTAVQKAWSTHDNIIF
jgi:hypothetical protein